MLHTPKSPLKRGLLSTDTFNEQPPEKTSGRNAGLMGLLRSVECLVLSFELDFKVVQKP